MEIEIPMYIQIVRGPVGRSAVWASDGGHGPVVGSGNFHIAAFGRISQWYSGWHPGTDIANSTGTPIYAVDGGSVEVAGWYGWAGNAVILDHGNGYESLYAHMNGVNVVAGQTVQRGQIIGTIGCTRGYGGRCTGPHLHLEVYYQGSYVNPCSVGACP
jgi:murein DD-endopeptidase MepM/ murein hydrolase activator NlpD